MVKTYFVIEQSMPLAVIIRAHIDSREPLPRCTVELKQNRMPGFHNLIDILVYTSSINVNFVIVGVHFMLLHIGTTLELASEE